MNITISVTFVTHWEVQVTGKTARENIYLGSIRESWKYHCMLIAILLPHQTSITSSFMPKFNKSRSPTAGFKRSISI
jgi:hypothetical protein